MLPGGGVFISRSTAVVLFLVTAACIIATGLSVFYFTPHELPSPEHHPYHIPHHEWWGVRLPPSLKPLTQVIKLQPFLNSNLSVLGYTEITFKVIEPTDRVILNMLDIVTNNDTIKLYTKTASNTRHYRFHQHQVRIIHHSYDHKRQFYTAELDEEIQPGQVFVLMMEFEGRLNEMVDGFYRTQYTNEDGDVITIAATQFQPTDARRAFPCFDEPALKAEFEVYLARQTNMTSLSNMPKIETTPVEDQPGWVWDRFEMTLPMSSYLLAFVVSDFENVNVTIGNNVTFRVWSRKELLSQTQYAIDVGPKMQLWYEEYFRVPYPLPKQDMIALPDAVSGMENWGLIVYREPFMLYDPLISSADDKQAIVSIIAHELAHMWFGDLVSPLWWTDLWLNEGFASYIQYLGVEFVEPDWKMLDQFVVKVLYPVLALDCLESSHAISIPVNNPDEIGQIFDHISYHKGASIIRMINHYLGEKTLRSALTKYLGHYEYSNTNKKDLWSFLTREAHKDGSLPSDLTVKLIMDTWTLQMGYPVITVYRNESDGMAMITQERFLLVKNPNSTDTHDYKWYVPINFVTQDNPDFNDTTPTIWMTSKEPMKIITGMPDSSKWVIFNKQQTGYYRVNYEKDNWKMIVNQLKTDHTKIPVINRAQLIDDAMALARAGLLPYSIALDVLSYLSKETEYVPWTAALDALKYIKEMMARTPAFGGLKRYLRKLLLPLYNSVGFADKPTDPHLDQLKRVSALYWMCNLEHEPCLRSAKDLFKKWMDNPTNSSTISPNLKEVVFCFGVAEGAEEEFIFGWDQLTHFTVPSEKMNMINGLGCTKHSWLLTKYLDLTYKTEGSKIRVTESYSVYVAVANNVAGEQLAWNYVQNNWSQLLRYYGSKRGSVRTLIKFGCHSSNTPLALTELKRFKQSHRGELDAASSTIRQTIETVANNIAWMDSNYDQIVNWLQDNGYHKNSF